MDSNLIKAVIKSNIMEKANVAEKYGSTISLSSNTSQEEDINEASKTDSTQRPQSGAMRAKSVKEVEEKLSSLAKENFDLKVRIYLLEERMGKSFNLDKGNLAKNNVDLMVQVESLKKEVAEKQDLLCQAVKVMELEEKDFKNNLESKDEQIAMMKQEIEELRMQLQDGRSDQDGGSSHKSFYSEPIYLPMQGLTSEPTNRIKCLQERISALESELNQEKETNASLQMVLDQSGSIRTRYEILKQEVVEKEDKIDSLTKELAETKEKQTKYVNQLKDLEKTLDQTKQEFVSTTNRLQEKSKQCDELTTQLNDFKRKYANVKTELEREYQRSEKNKLVYDMRLSELMDEGEKNRTRIQELQKKVEMLHQELKSNQNLLVSKSPQRRSNITNTDVDSFSVSNTAASAGIQKADALCVPLTPEEVRRLIEQGDPTAVVDHYESLSEHNALMSEKVVKLKAEQLKACTIIKSLMSKHTAAVEEIAKLKKRIDELERELEGVVTKPAVERVADCPANTKNDRAATATPLADGKEQPTMNENGDDEEIIGKYKVLVEQLEKKSEILLVTLQEKDKQISAVEDENKELLEILKRREEELVDFEFNMLATPDGSTINLQEAKESEDLYKHLLREKNEEIERLNEELRKRTSDLQALVNKELWEKNREITKLQSKHAAVLEQNSHEIAELKQELNVRNMQLQVLKKNISALGDPLKCIENGVSKIPDELEALKEERKQLMKTISELQKTVSMKDTVMMASGDCQNEHLIKLRQDYAVLKEKHERSENLRFETNEVCTALSIRLEELALFMDSLLKQRSVLGFLGGRKNKKIKELIDQSLDLSRNLSITLISNPDQSLLQLSNITAILNSSQLSNITTELSHCDDSNLENSNFGNNTLTYQSHFYQPTTKTAENEEFSLHRIIAALREQIVNLKYELQLRDNELSRINNDSCPAKLPSESSPTEVSSRKELRVVYENKQKSPSSKSHNITSSTLVFHSDNQSESETWSEPDRNVSKARIGLKDEELKPNVKGNLNLIYSSDSTEDEISRNPKRDILNESHHTIVVLHKQVCDLEKQLSERESEFSVMQKNYEKSHEQLKRENVDMKKQLEDLDSQLEETRNNLICAEGKKLAAENQLVELKCVIEDLEASKKELEQLMENKSKETLNKINELQLEKEQLVVRCQEAEKQLEEAKISMVTAEEKLESMQAEMVAMEQNLALKYEQKTIEKLTRAEEEFLKRIRAIEETATREISELRQTIVDMELQYKENYVLKSSIDSKVAEVEKLSKEVDDLKECLRSCKSKIQILEESERRLKQCVSESEQRCSIIRSDLNNATLQYSEAVLEKTKLANDKTNLEQELNSINDKETKMRNQLVDIQSEIKDMKEHYELQISSLRTQKLKLEVKTSELESANAELYNKLVKIQAGQKFYSSSLPNALTNYGFTREVQLQRQFSDQSTTGVSEVETCNERRCVFQQPSGAQDVERNEANSSPDLGIESDHGRFSSLEVQSSTTRPLLQTLELTENMNNLLVLNDNSVQTNTCGDELCCKKSVEMASENSDLKRKLLRTRRALEETVTQLTLANQRKKQVEKTICKQIHKTSQVLRKAKANLDSGSETDFAQKVNHL